MKEDLALAEAVELRPRRESERLELSVDEMRSLGYQVIDMLVDHFEQLEHKPTARRVDRTALSQRLGNGFLEEPTQVNQILKQLEVDVFPNMGLTTHPRFFAFVPGPSNFVSVMADALASGFNVYSGNAMESAGPCQVEDNVLGWLHEQFGFPATAGGLFVSGGSTANLTALATARHVKLIEGAASHAALNGNGRSVNGHAKINGHAKANGHTNGKAISPASDTLGGVAYCSDQTHSSVDRAFRVLGMAPSQLVKIPCDRRFRLPLDELRRRVRADKAAGKRPFCVIANAGTTSTGAIDPLPELADFCQRENLWLHADGAYGAAAMLCDEGRELLAGLDRVDSLCVDPHKWLFQPYDAGCLLVRDKQQLFRTFRVSADYLSDVQDASEEAHYQDCGIQLTRSFRALKLWMSLKVFGLEAFRKAVQRGFALAESVERVARNTPRLQVLSPANLAICCFRYVRPGMSLDEANSLNQRIADHTLMDEFAAVTSTVVKGRKVLRMCTINPRTRDDDIVRTVIHVRDVGDAIWRGVPIPSVAPMEGREHG